MNEDEKMLHIGMVMLVAGMLVTAVLQVCYRNQNKALNRVRHDIVKTQQETAVVAANFASYVRPEILRNLVVSIYPQAQVIGFNKTVSIDQLQARE